MVRLFPLFAAMVSLLACPASVFGRADLSYRDSLRSSAREAEYKGNYDDAIKLWTAFIDSAPKRKDIQIEGHGARARCLKKTARYAEALRDYDAGISAARRSDSVARAYQSSQYVSGYVSSLPILMLNKSDLLIQTGAYKEAVRVLSFKCDIDTLEARRVANMASAKMGMGEKAEAISLMDSVLSMTSLSKKDSAIVLQNRGYAHMSMPRPDYGCAVVDLREASNLVDGFERYVILSNLAMAEANEGLVDAAIKDVEAALAGMEEARGVNHPDYLRVLRKKAEILMLKGRNDAYDAYVMYFNGERSFVTDNFVRMTEQWRLDLWKMEKPLISKMFALEDYAPSFLFDVALFRREIALLGQADIAGSERRMREKLSISGDDVRKAMGKNDVALDFVRYEKDSTERYGVIVAPSYASGGEVKFIPLWAKGDLEGTVLADGRHLYEAVRSSNMSDKDAIYRDTALTRKVWDSILPYIPDGSDVYFAPDGLLHILAIENLPLDMIPSFSKKSVRLHRVTSVSVLLERGGTGCQNQEILVAGGLDYDNVGEDVQRQAVANHDAVDMLDSQMNGRWRFAKLEGARREADSVVAMLGGASRQSMLFEEEIKKFANKYGLIHLSTHGYALDVAQEDTVPFALRDSVVESRELLASGLAFSGANRLRDSIGRDDGILSARELCEMDLHNVDFFVLCACQTAMGGISDEGPAGLVRGLKKAGVKTIVATLWNVDDNATCAFMTHFYKEMASGKGKSESMDDTRRWMREIQEPVTAFDAASLASRPLRDENGNPSGAKIYDSPRYWAAFILIDDV